MEAAELAEELNQFERAFAGGHHRAEREEDIQRVEAAVQAGPRGDQRCHRHRRHHQRHRLARASTSVPGTDRPAAVQAGDFGGDYCRVPILVSLPFSRRKRRRANVPAVLAWLRAKAVWVEPVPLGRQRSRDIKDEKFLAAALSARAKAVLGWNLGNRRLLLVSDARIRLPAAADPACFARLAASGIRHRKAQQQASRPYPGGVSFAGRSGNRK